MIPKREVLEEASEPVTSSDVKPIERCICRGVVADHNG